MPDRFGSRGVIALMIPQQNSNMHPEYELLRPDGISNQVLSLIHISEPTRLGMISYAVFC